MSECARACVCVRVRVCASVYCVYVGSANTISLYIYKVYTLLLAEKLPKVYGHIIHHTYDAYTVHLHGSGQT